MRAYLTQIKLKYSIAAYCVYDESKFNDYDIMTLKLRCLELNDSIIEQPWYRKIVKIEIGRRIVTEE